jgi:hypothetical protein
MAVVPGRFQDLAHSIEMRSRMSMSRFENGSSRSMSSGRGRERAGKRDPLLHAADSSCG